MADITLGSATRTNLLSLQSTQSLIDRTQGRLATGLKVNNALDDALAKYPLLSASVSAGNEGPGLGSIGTPAGARWAVVASRR